MRYPHEPGFLPALVCVLAIAAIASATTPIYEEDFEGAGSDIADFGFTQPNGWNDGPQPVGVSAGLGGRALLPPTGGDQSLRHSTTPIDISPALADDVISITLRADMYATTLGGDGYVGISTGACCNNTGIHIGASAGAWKLDLRGMGDSDASGLHLIDTTGFDMLNKPVVVEAFVDLVANMVTGSVTDPATGDSISVATALIEPGNFAGITSISIQGVEIVQSPDIDNISLTYVIPEPATVALLGLGVLGLCRRRR